MYLLYVNMAKKLIKKRKKIHRVIARKLSESENFLTNAT